MLASVEHENQQCRCHEKNQDTVGIIESETAGNQLSREISVLGHYGEKERETCKCCVGSKAQYDNCHDLNYVVHDAALSVDGSGKY